MREPIKLVADEILHALDGIKPIGAVGPVRKSHHAGRCADARQLAQCCEDPFKGGAGLDVLRLRFGGNACGQHQAALGLVSQVYCVQGQKAAEEQAGSKR